MDAVLSYRVNSSTTQSTLVDHARDAIRIASRRAIAQGQYKSLKVFSIGQLSIMDIKGGRVVGSHGLYHDDWAMKRISLEIEFDSDVNLLDVSVWMPSDEISIGAVFSFGLRGHEFHAEFVYKNQVTVLSIRNLVLAGGRGILTMHCTNVFSDFLDQRPRSFILGGIDAKFEELAAP